MKKTLITILATVLVCCCVVGGTLAWLMDSTQTVTNTFTVGNVSITLTETGATQENGYAQSFKMIPGKEYTKNPTVTVVDGSESCYVFVKVEKANNVDNFISYDIATTGEDAWKPLDGVANVYYRTYTAGEANPVYPVLVNNKVTVKNTVTKDMVKDLTEDAYPKLSFTAYAVQSEGVENAAAAWRLANPTT